MKILVIGGAGYIGSHVARILLDRNYKVTVYDNLSSGRKENLFKKEAHFILGDILDYNLLCQTLKSGFDGIVHLAALKAAGESMIQPEKYAVNNICGTINILNAASKYKVQKIIFSSSAAVYGEPQYLPIDEKHQTKPENFYGYTKLEIERLLKWYDKIKNIRYAALRYFNAAGYDIKGRICGIEKNPQNLLPKIMEVAAGMRDKIRIYGDDYDTRDGTGLRDYIHVTDLAEAHVKSLEYIDRENQSLITNLGSETGITVKEMVEESKAITNYPIPVEIADRRLGDPAVVLATASNAKKILSWQPQYSNVQTLISSTWNVYKHIITQK
jgi:UDP-glucose 4-epimerase